MSAPELKARVELALRRKTLIEAAEVVLKEDRKIIEHDIDAVQVLLDDLE